MKKIINLTETRISNLSGAWKCFPKVGSYIKVLHDNSSERMQVLECNKKYLICDNKTGIEQCVIFNKEETETELVFRFYTKQ